MIYADALNQIIDDGIEEARGDYAKPAARLKLEGAVRGFEECRDKTPSQLAALLNTANEDVSTAYRQQAPNYWYWRCRALEIEWTANVMSAILLSNGMPIIMAPTVRGVLKAAEIVGLDR